MHPAHGGAEGRSDFYWVKTLASSFSCPLFLQPWQTVDPVLGPFNSFDAWVEQNAPSTRARSWSEVEPPAARRPQARVYGGQRPSRDQRRPRRFLLRKSLTLTLFSTQSTRSLLMICINPVLSIVFRFCLVGDFPHILRACQIVKVNSILHENIFKTF